MNLASLLQQRGMGAKPSPYDLSNYGSLTPYTDPNYKPETRAFNPFRNALGSNATPYDDSQGGMYQADRWGRMYGLDGNMLWDNTDDERPIPKFTSEGHQAALDLYKKYGYSDFFDKENILEQGLRATGRPQDAKRLFTYMDNYALPTEINNKLYIPVDPNTYTGDSFGKFSGPSVAATRRAVRDNIYTDAGGLTWVDPRLVRNADNAVGELNNADEGDLIGRIGPGLAAGFMLGPAVAAATGVPGATALSSLWGDLGFSNPFSSIGNPFSGATAGGSAFGVPPESYWSMMADAGGAATDAASGGGMGWTDIFSGVDNWDLMGDPSAYGLGGAADAFSGAIAGGSGGGDLTALLQRLAPNPLTSLIGSGIQGLSSLLAANAQRQAGNQALGTLNSQYAQNRADLAPYREAGYGALDRLTAMTTPGNQFTAMQADPGYQFRYDQGLRALDNRLKAGGKFYSGSALKAGQDYAQGTAAQEFGNVFNRNAALSGIGQTATNTGVQSGNALSGLLANNQTDMGNARASGYVGVGNAVQGGLNQYNNANMTNALLQLLASNRGIL